MTNGSDPLFSVNGRIVIVTGGLGQLGRQFTRTLLERGARVAIFDAQVEGAGEKPDRNDSAEVLLCSVDVTSRASIEAGLAQVNAAWGVPDALINNAALDSPPGAPAAENGPFETYPGSSWDRVMEVNVKGVMQCCQVVGGQMAEAGNGSIVNISSIYGLISPDQRLYEYRRGGGEPFFKPIAYSASKSALLNLTRYLATYWGPRGVRVNTLTFGGVFNHQDPEFIEGYEARVPLGRMADETDYNAAVVFLVSDASRYMSGSNMVLDGGWTAW